MNIQKQGKLQITKVDKENRMVFGFFNVNKIGDELVEDLQQDIIETEELEKAAYDFVLNARIAGDSHLRKGVGNLVESMVFTVEKQLAILKTLEQIGIKDAQFNLGIEGWWGGFQITDEEVLAKIDNGDYPMFSVGGKAEQRIEEE
jgi:hypothetical protein